MIIFVQDEFSTKLIQKRSCVRKEYTYACSHHNLTFSASMDIVFRTYVQQNQALETRPVVQHSQHHEQWPVLSHKQSSFERRLKISVCMFLYCLDDLLPWKMVPCLHVPYETWIILPGTSIKKGRHVPMHYDFQMDQSRTFQIAWLCAKLNWDSASGKSRLLAVVRLIFRSFKSVLTGKKSAKGRAPKDMARV